MLKRYPVVLLSYLFLLGILVSCENMVSDVDAPTSPEKIVVVGFITPDLPHISIKVFKSRPLYVSYETDGTTSTVKDAIVKISNNGSTVVLPYDGESDSYKISQSVFRIARGETYYLAVTQGEFSANAHCTVPEIATPVLEITGIDSSYSDFQLYYHANLRFKDEEGQGNYYHVSVASVYTGEGGMDPYLYEVGFSRGDPFVSDKNKDGNYFTYTSDDIYSYPGESLRLVLTIGSTDENYYLYHKGIESFEDDNPFAEPSPIYSNIIGGLGVFAAYNQNISVIEH